MSPSTLWNASALETRNVPKRMLGRIAILPRGGLSGRMLLRLIFEMQILRYTLPLIPFVIAVFVWPHLALPIAQAPVLMLLAVALIETKALTIKREDREALIPDADMARALDALRFNARHVLTQIAAKRALTKGELLLVIEQSELARITPLTLVSLQQADPQPHVLTLDEDECKMLRECLFDDQVSERTLHLVSLREAENLRSIALNVADISAHARMTALLNARQPTDDTPQRSPA